MDVAAHCAHCSFDSAGEDLMEKLRVVWTFGEGAGMMRLRAVLQDAPPEESVWEVVGFQEDCELGEVYHSDDDVGEDNVEEVDPRAERIVEKEDVTQEEYSG